MSNTLKRVMVERIDTKAKIRKGYVIDEKNNASIDFVDSITIQFDSGHTATYLYLHDSWTPKRKKRGEYKITQIASEVDHA